MSVFAAPNLCLRELRPDDAGNIFDLFNDPACLRFIGDRGISDRTKALEWIERQLRTYRDNGLGFWAAERAEDQKFIGISGFARREFLDAPDLGYAILAEHRSHGYAGQCAAACLARAKHSLGLSHLWALVHPENSHSIALLLRAGFHVDPSVHTPGGPLATTVLRRDLAIEASHGRRGPTRP
jgi:RimJ/RimL family protein N-acetyltransferase